MTTTYPIVTMSEAAYDALVPQRIRDFGSTRVSSLDANVTYMGQLMYSVTRGNHHSPISASHLAAAQVATFGLLFDAIEDLVARRVDPKDEQDALDIAELIYHYDLREAAAGLNAQLDDLLRNEIERQMLARVLAEQE